jgi:PUA domain protein
MKRTALDKKTAKDLGYPKGSRAELVEIEGATLYLVDGKPWKIDIQGKIVPWLSETNSLKRVTIDMGAVPFITKGADLMGQGITKHDPAVRGELVSIVDEKNGKQLAIGEVITDGIQKQGKTVKVLHYAGDKYWNALKAIL